MSIEGFDPRFVRESAARRAWRLAVGQADDTYNGQGRAKRERLNQFRQTLSVLLEQMECSTAEHRQRIANREGLSMADIREALSKLNERITFLDEYIACEGARALEKIAKMNEAKRAKAQEAGRG
jgi:hypothetical protein